MNRISQFTVIFLLLCFGSFCHAQQIMNIIEQYGATELAVGKGNNNIVDINSQLEIRIAKDSILKVLSRDYPQFQNQVDLEEEISTLEKLLEDQTTIINTLKKELRDADSRRKFYAALINFHETVRKSGAEFEQQVNAYLIEYREMYPEGPSQAPMSRMEYVMQQLNKKLIDVRDKLSAMDGSGIKISLVGFKADKSGGSRVHIKNFDTYSDMEYVTIPRWVTSLSDEQEERLGKISNTLENNKVELKQVFEEMKAKFTEYLPDLSCFSDLKSTFSGLLTDSALKDAIDQDKENLVNRFLSDLEKLKELTNDLKTDLSSLDISTPFKVKDKVVEIIEFAQNVDLDFKSLLTNLNTVAALKGTVDSISSDTKKCVSGVIREFKAIKEALGLLGLQQQKYVANKDIGEEVIKFTVSTLPAVGYLNLKGTGQRQNGDSIILEVILRPDTSDNDTANNSSEPIILEQKTMIMQLVGVRSQVAVGMIFADPFSDDETIIDPERQHFFTPMAALLLKFGSRKSNFYNNFVDIGIGVNFASPDFNTDGVPEFGTGLILTAFRDILNTGVNYNVTNDTFYWFFGVNLPFNIPGIPINTVQSTTESN